MIWRSTCAALAVSAVFPAGSAVRAQEQQKPDILVIFGDDIDQSDVSAYSMGVMGFHTPNIDRIAHEGMMFTDY